jgi:hypothetical protein
MIKEPVRPYSQRELEYKRNKGFRELRVGNVRANHKKCKHFYFVKKNGRKEKEIKERNSSDVGNCSVCWKIINTPSVMRSEAIEMVNGYCSMFYEQPLYMTYVEVECEKLFYDWLYRLYNK